MTAHVLSTNLGAPRDLPGVRHPSGIAKVPVPALELRDPGPKSGGLGSGAVGDFIGSRQHHGGSGQAVYAVAREELDWWAGELGRELPDGMFGENLTLTGLDVDGALLGETWAVGDEVVLEVAGPRIPCATFAARMGERTWVRRFTERGRSGAYLAVLTPGTVRPGDRVEVLTRPEHGVDVPTSMRAWLGDLDLMRAIVEAGVGREDFRAELEDKLASRARASISDTKGR